jgi:ferredoxin
MGKITKVWLDESENECISCGACEATIDMVFEVPDKMIIVKGSEQYFESHDEEIREAAQGCPVDTIGIAEDGSEKRCN